MSDENLDPLNLKPATRGTIDYVFNGVSGHLTYNWPMESTVNGMSLNTSLLLRITSDGQYMASIYEDWDE